MKIKSRSYLPLLLCPLLLGGCATPAHRVDDQRKLNSIAPTTDDYALIAGQMVQSMFESGALDKSPHKPANLCVGKIKNDTRYQFDDLNINELSKKIRTILNQSGKTITDVTGGAITEPDFTLSGKIIDKYVTQGRRKQHTYIFQLSLTDSQARAVWEDEKEVTKQETKPLF